MQFSTFNLSQSLGIVWTHNPPLCTVEEKLAGWEKQEAGGQTHYRPSNKNPVRISDPIESVGAKLTLVSEKWQWYMANMSAK